MPLKTLDVLERSFKAGLLYSERRSLSLTIEFAQHNRMQLRMTNVPVDYPLGNLLRCRPGIMRALFDDGADCAGNDQLLQSPQALLARVTDPVAAQSAPDACPLVRAGASHGG